MTVEIDAVYDGQPFNYVDTRNDPLAQALFRGAVEQLGPPAAEAQTLATGSLPGGSSIHVLIRATDEPARCACWSPDEVRQRLAAAEWPNLDLLDETTRREVLAAQFFLQACAAGGYGIQFT